MRGLKKIARKENELAEKVRTLDEMTKDALETLEATRGSGDYAYEWTEKISTRFSLKRELCWENQFML